MIKEQNITINELQIRQLIENCTLSEKHQTSNLIFCL
jgi:hypothetical protein